MSVPLSSLGLPQEMMLGNLDYSIPSDAKSFSVRVQPSNLSSVSSTFSTGTSAGNLGDITFPSSTLYFDIPCGQSPSTFLDSRFTTLNFTVNFAVASAGTAASFSGVSSYIRSNASAFFDRLWITSQTGAIVEDIGEFGLVNDTLIALQMNNAVRHGLANQYGFDSSDSTKLGSQGRKINILSSNTLAAGQTETMSFSIPLPSALVGCLADKFCNVGRTSKIQLALQTSTVAPLTVVSAGATAAGSVTITLSNLSLGLEYIDIGLNALKMLDSTLVDNKAYQHGVTYRTSSASLPQTAGSASLLAGIRCSSLKSLFVRFAQAGTAGTTNASSGKYDSFNPCLNNFNINVGGLKYPQAPINPLLQPATAFSEVQKACGAFNNAQFQSCIPPAKYCSLSVGGTAQALTTGATQDWMYATGSDPSQQNQFILGVNTEVVARRGLLSGLNCSSAPIFVEMNIASALTNAHTMYAIGMLDCIFIHDVATGDISVRV